MRHNAMHPLRSPSNTTNRGGFQHRPAEKYPSRRPPVHISISVTILVFLVCILCVLFSGIALNAQNESSLPLPQGYVNDLAGILSPQTTRHLEGLITALNRATTAEVAVVTVESIAPSTIEEYAVRLFETWGIGQKDKDNGVLLLVALREREVRIEVGYGLEGAITDGTAGQIIRSIIVPEFKRGDFDQGVLAGTEAIMRLITKEYNVEFPEGTTFKTQARVEPTGSSGLSSLFMFFLGLFILFIIIRSGLWPLLFIGFPPGGGRGGWSGGGGGFGGGFGGFGGGLSGGGGASGSW
ncbi:MAG: TPM domain-containing protein [bacterium]